MSAVFGVGVQCAWCETLAGANRARDGEVVEEDVVGHDARKILRSR